MLEGIRHLKPSEFSKFYFDFDPLPYQINALDCQDKDVQLVWGRQCGKSTITALRGLYDAMMNDEWTVLVLSHTDRQAARLFRKMKVFITKSAKKFPELRLVDMIDRETQRLFEFSNGSEIIAAPIADDGANIRGFTAHRVIIDEAADITNPDVWSAINPMTMVTGGGQWLIGTLKGVNNQFYKIYQNPQVYNFKQFITPSIENPYADQKKMELDKLRMSIAMWEQEYLCIPMEETDSYFPHALVQRVVQKYDPYEAPLGKDYVYYLGVDPAGEGLDSTVYCIGMRTPSGRLLVAKWIAVKHQTQPQIDTNIRLLHSIWNFQKIFIDCTGGRNLHEFLFKDGYPAEGYWFSIKTKQEIYSELKKRMQGESFSMYQHDEALKQILDMRYEATKQGENIKIFSGQSRDHNMPGGDDYPTALALMVWGTKTPEVPLIYGRVRSMFAKQES